MPANPSIRRSCIVAVLLLAQAALAQAPVPEFDVAYRAWDAVTELARQQRDPSLSGECGKTFRPFVIPGLRRQTKQEQDIAAIACVQAARAACRNGKLQKPGELARKCEEFR